MATSEAADRSDVERDLTPFRMTAEQHRRAVEAGIFGGPGRVDLVDGLLVERGIGEGPEYLLAAEQVLRMLAADVFEDDESRRFTLWEGRLVGRMGRNRPHCFSTRKLDRLLDRLVPDRYHVEAETPMLLGERSLPEPDLMVIRGTLDDYRARVPTAGDVALIVEVADSSVRFDSGAKLTAYAAGGIPVYWIINLGAGRIEVYARPAGLGGLASYQELREYGRDDEIPVVLDGDEVGRIAAREFLP